MKPISGTFIDEITCDIPSQNWGISEWKKEFDTFSASGIDTLILIRCGYREMWAYPTEVVDTPFKGCTPDLIQLFLEESAKRNIDFYLGCYDSGLLDRTGDYKHDWEINQKVINELMNRYGSHPAFKGWYVAPEGPVAAPCYVEIFKRLSDRMKELTPQKPVLISPYYPSWNYSSDTPSDRMKKFIDDWYKILSQSPGIDIVAFQDGSCNFTQPGYPLFELEEYIKTTHALLKDLKRTQWNNVECFWRECHIKFPPMDWRLLKKKMEIADPYVEKQITFEFSHFMSPNSCYQAARNLYSRYMEKIFNK